MTAGIKFPRMEGRSSRQAHCDLPGGTYEREFGSEGFFGPVSHLYHTHPPTGWSHWEGDLRPRAFDFGKLGHPAQSPWHATPVLHNAHLRLRLWHMAGTMDCLVCNADGDELLFVHQGQGNLFCDFGHMAFREGDYVLLPRGLRWRVECPQTASFLLIEATGESYRLPERGLVGPQAIFDSAMLDVPAIDDPFKAQQGETPWRVVIKRHQRFSTVTFPFNPLDAVGWHGDNLPVRINWRDIRPLMSHRYHLPPSAHATFAAKRFVVCTFVPRPLESDPGALKVPFYHSNNDFDEIIFYHQGEFFSRDNIRPGMMTLHPCGFPHGPHPKAFAAGVRAAKKDTDEVAVMIDARDAVDISEAAREAEWKEYVESWKI
ncbi:MAG: homogentisate 1,2-dioxygenase [Pseudomonadota bacterium]|nr:homogentisate 1,2-dioxygenase [Pseudomonadota bacterium]MDE3038597.1 homogentisate 1,2-dioxygenase [Pseudomonadota bacterium]